MFRILFAVAVIAAPFTPLFSFGAQPDGAQVAAPRAESVRVPVAPNTTCPIMGKPISLKLFTDTERGRIWVCCKGCIADIHDDLELAYRTAWPTTSHVDATTCPVTGKALREDSPLVELQGLRFRVLDAAAAKRAVEHSQVTLARLREPKLVDVGNTNCPVDGKPVVANAFVVIDGRIVHLSSPKHVEELTKDPKKALEAALKEAGKAR
jgi:hypothetical protein